MNIEELQKIAKAVAKNLAVSTQRTDLVLDALEQALWSRKHVDGQIQHSDRGSQHQSIRYSERLAEAGIESSVGSVGDSYDIALAENH